jgi:integrating conjugative element relaxase (TIGR03760 family)
LNDRTWSDFILPVIHHVAELVQLLPASESHHHAQPGGLWIHTCETLRHAIRLRQGVVLPAGRDAEDQARHKHRWTGGMIVAALLHDAGKPMTDLNVRLYGDSHRGTPWNALAGDMRTARATDYAVGFPKEGERDYRAHQRHGALLMQRLVPAHTLTWIGEDPPLLLALMQYLAGDAKDAENPIATLRRRGRRL